MSSEKTRTIQVDYLARVEGEGGLRIKTKGNKVTSVELNIFEPPRFFEALLRGRLATEAPDITSRICGICPIAYQMTAVHAVESALGVQTSPGIEILRRLLYCGEWIESHALHLNLLHAPDFLGYESAIAMAKDHPEIVQRGLDLKKTGNEIMALIGGREIHPVNVKVGGFYRAPAKSELKTLLPRLQRAREAAEQTLHWAAAFSFPDWERDYELVALRSSQDHYPIEEGTLISSGGLEATASQYETYFEEIHVAHSTALHSVIRGRGSYLVGPLARFNLNFDRLSESCRRLATEIGLTPPCRNPFKSLLARGIEILYACEEAIRIIESYEPPTEPSVPLPARAGTGCAMTEAPRGLIFHRYRIAANGQIEDAKIVPPTSQNQRSIEEDLRKYVETNVNLPKKELTWGCEQTVRNYDPCISCAAHFLEVKFEEQL